MDHKHVDRTKLKKLAASITAAQVKHVASLARLPLKPAQIGKFRSQLARILDYMGQIGKLRTAGESETSHAIGITNRMRTDEVTSPTRLSQQAALSNAKRTRDGYFVVDAIFEP